MSTADRKVIDIKPGDISPHPHNPRRVVGDVTDLAESIREVGVLQPATVAPRLDRKDGEAAWTYIMGHRRGAATTLAGLPTLPCLVRTDLDTHTKQLKAMVGENDGREDLTPVEQAEAYQELLDLDCTVEEIAHAASKSVTTVRARLDLMKLTEPLRERIHVHELNLTDAAALVEFSDSPDDLARAEAAIGNEANWRWVIEDIRRARTGRVKREKTLAKLKDKGVKVVKAPASWHYDTSAKVRPVTQLAKPDGTDYTKPATEHASCPGHAAVVGDAGQIEWACKLPKTHPKRAVTSRREATVEDEQLEQDLATAQRLRIAHVADMLATGLDATSQQKLLAGFVAEAFDAQLSRVGEDEFAACCQLLGLDGPTTELDDEQLDLWRADLMARIGAAPIGTLIGWWAAAQVLEQEFGGYNLTSPWVWTRRSESFLGYMGWLTGLGYQPSEVETRLLGPADEEQAS